MFVTPNILFNCRRYAGPGPFASALDHLTPPLIVRRSDFVSDFDRCAAVVAAVGAAAAVGASVFTCSWSGGVFGRRRFRLGPAADSVGTPTDSFCFSSAMLLYPRCTSAGSANHEQRHVQVHYCNIKHGARDHPGGGYPLGTHWVPRVPSGYRFSGTRFYYING